MFPFHLPKEHGSTRRFDPISNSTGIWQPYTVSPGAIALEIWEMPVAQYGSFVALIPAPLGIGTLSLADGTSVQGFVCEALATQGAQDITHLGGWRAYIASR